MDSLGKANGHPERAGWVFCLCSLKIEEARKGYDGGAFGIPDPERGLWMWSWSILMVWVL
jgi:hypothetical protein